MLDAMRAGVNEFVPEPITAAALSGDRARRRARAGQRAGQVFAFVGAKGGVGTTTMAVNVATALAKAGARDAACRLAPGRRRRGGVPRPEPRFSVADALENTHRLDQTFLRASWRHDKAAPRCLPRPIARSRARRHEQFRALLEFAARLYRYVVLDVPRSEPPCSTRSRPLASIFVVANQELATVRSASRLAVGAPAALRAGQGDGRSCEPLRSTGGHRVGRHREGGWLAVEAHVPKRLPAALQALNQGRPLALENHNNLSSDSSFAQELAKSRANGRATQPARPARPPDRPRVTRRDKHVLNPSSTSRSAHRCGGRPRRAIPIIRS